MTDEKTSLECELESIENYLEDEAELPVTPDNWKNASVGDVIRIEMSRRKINYSVVLKQCDDDGFLTPSMTNDWSKPLQNPNGHEIKMGWTKNESDDERKLTYLDTENLATKRFMHVGTDKAKLRSAEYQRRIERKEKIEKRLAAISDRLKKLVDTEGHELNQLRERLENVEAEARKEATKEVEELDKQLERHKAERADPLSSHPFPHTKKIQRLKLQLDANAPRLEDITVAELAAKTNGFSYRHIRDLIQSCAATGDGMQQLLSESRLQILRGLYGDLLEIVEPQFGFEHVAGNTPPIRAFKEFASYINNDETWRLPQGCLLTGPPGGGKSFKAEALAAECGWLVVKPKEVRGPYLGQSEQRIERQIQAIRDIQYLVILRDEVDRTDTQRDAPQGDSGTSGRISSFWMDLLNDPSLHGKIFVVSMTNRPDLMDMALKRAGRTDVIMPVLPPDKEMRKALFPVLVKQLGHLHPEMEFVLDVSEDELDRLASQTEWFMPTEIKLALRNAFMRSGNTDGSSVTVTVTDISQQIDNLLLRSRKQMAEWCLISIQECSDRSLLPENVEEVIKSLRKMAAGAKRDESRNSDSAYPVMTVKKQDNGMN